MEEKTKDHLDKGCMNTIEVFKTKTCTMQLQFPDTFLEITTQVKTWNAQCFIGREMTSTQITPGAIEAKSYFTFGHFLPFTLQALTCLVSFSVLLLHP